MKYSGMTVNERLYISGLLQKFDDAVKKKDINKIIKILKEVELEESSINPILKALGLNRNK
jgi:hypothetical protein